MIMCDTCKSVARTVATPYTVLPAKYFVVVDGWTVGIRSYCDYHVNGMPSNSNWVDRSVFVTMEAAEIELLKRAL